MSSLISVVVVNWNGRRYLRDCLIALNAQTYPRREVILVDNASTDGSAEYVAAEFPEVHLIRMETNAGFAAANNLGFHAAQGEFIATLNNDTQADPDWLSELIKGMCSVDRVGMCASKMLFADSPEVINSAGVSMDIAGFAWDREGGRQDTEDEDRPLEVFGPCAGAALYSRSLLEAVGGFDEDYFIYLEDVDMAWRARWLGWRCLYVPTAKVWHIHSAAMIDGSPLKNYLLGRNKVWTLFKNLPRAAAPWIPLIIFYDVLSVGYSLVIRRDVNPLKGRLAGLMGLPKMWPKRRVIQRGRTIRVEQWRQMLSPLEAPWAIQRRFQYLRARNTRTSSQVVG